MQFNITEAVPLGAAAGPRRAEGFGDGISLESEALLRDRSHPSARWWPERLAAVLALAGVVAASLPGYHVRAWQDAGSDFKTVYASGKCYLHGLPAYNFTNIGHVFQQNGVVQPWTWYAHAPTYPPFTFAALGPILALPMVPAVYTWLLVSTMALILATWAMAGQSQRVLGLARGWRLLLVVLVAASPLVSFGLGVGNVSVVACALCVTVVMCTDVASPNWLAAVLTYSLLLKPHVALCLILGMAISPDRKDRAVAVRGLVFFAAALLCFGLIFSLRSGGLQLHDYAAMVRQEMASGSMNPSRQDILPMEAEITSLASLLGFFGKSAWVMLLNGTVLAGMFAVLVAASRSRANQGSEERLEVLGAWSTFGLLLTYHRAHDGILLLLLLPWMLLRWQRRWTDPVAWAASLLLSGIGFGFDRPALFALSTHHGLFGLSQLLLFRQAPLATVLLMLLLLAHLAERARAARVSDLSGWQPVPAPVIRQLPRSARP